MKPERHNLQIFSWALYDWANSAFATAVMAGFFPVLFRQYWSASREVTLTTFRLGVANSVASIIIAVSAPILGAVSDRFNKRKSFLIVFAMLGVGMTGALFFIPRGQCLIAGFLYVLATIGFLGGNVFYDSLLLDVATPNLLNWVSALGYSLGYIGGGILFAISIGMVMVPETFGFSSKISAVRAVFLLVAFWWAFFSIPLFLFVRERRGTHGGPDEKLGRQFTETLKMIVSKKSVLMFLAGYYLYIDGVGTIVRMAVDYGMSLGLNASDLILALLVTQVVGFPATLLFGKIGQRIGAKRGILIGLGVYIAITLGSMFIMKVRDFFILAVAVGLVQGGVQSLSRSLFALFVPSGKEASYFGVYNMLGRFAAVLGPFLMGLTAFLTKSTRMGVLAVAVLFIGGACFLIFTRESEEKQEIYF